MSESEDLKMPHFLKIIFTIKILIFFSNGYIFGNTQIIILTDNVNTGSYIFASELNQQLLYSKYNNKFKLIKKIQSSQESRLKNVNNNINSIAIIDAKTASENLKKFPRVKVMSVLWENWLFTIGNSLKPNINFENTKSLLIHENSYYFAKFWKSFSTKTKLKWFNENNIPNFEKSLLEEVVIFSGPKSLKEIFYWLEKYAGIKLLSLDQKIIKSLRLNYKWLIPKKIPANTFPYQSKSIFGLKWHPVLICHSGLSEQIILSLIKIIYSQKEKIIPHPLFKNLIISDNKIFQNIFPFHTSSKNVFRFK